MSNILNTTTYFDGSRKGIFGLTDHVSMLNLPKYKYHQLSKDEKSLIDYLIDYINSHSVMQYTWIKLRRIERYSSLDDPVLELILTFTTNDDFYDGVYTFKIQESSENTLEIKCTYADDHEFDQDAYLQDAYH